LASRLVVAYSGHSRISAGTNWALYKRFLDGEEVAKQGLQGIAAIALALEAKLRAGDLDGAGELLGEEWQHRRSLAEGVSTPALEGLMDAARKAGALGGKACGAGGGGCLAFLVREGTRLDVEAALEREGARVLAAHPVERGHFVEVE
jgi:D-glycero-alpha-D-manno-heptose-7-phosphate kinase